MWWKKNKWKIITPVMILALLAAAFWYGGDAPGAHGWTANGDQTVTAEQQPDEPSVREEEKPAADQEAPSEAEPEPEQPAEQTTPAPEANTENPSGNMTAQDKLDAASQIAGGSSAGAPQGDETYSEQQGMTIDPNTGKDEHGTEPVPDGKPVPVDPEDVTVTDTAHTCTISISCATVLNNMDRLGPDKAELVPTDGWILSPTTVTFYEGESVFNVFQRTCKQQGIHMEFENTPMYHSAYVEGIGNLYEFDCGELSGWMYKVNGWFPNYGCSRYQLHEGDTISWVYTCDLGVDVGGYYAAAN